MKKIIITTDALKPALSKLGQAINPKSVLPVLLNLYCRVTPGKLEMIASNQEITIYYRVDCEAKEAFEFLIPFEFLSKVVSISGSIPLVIESGKQIKITGENDIYEIKMADKIEDFPKLQELPKKNYFFLPAEILACLHIAVTTTGKYDVNPKFAHVLLELAPGKITIASTDGSYMVFSKEFISEQTEKEDLLISLKAIKVLTGLHDIKVYYHSKAIGFESETITVVNTRTENKFVNFRQVFPPDWPANLSFNRHDMLQALDKCSLCNDQLHQTKINIENKKEIKLSADDSILKINVSVTGEYSGEVKQVYINSEKLLKLLHQVEHHEIKLALHDAQKAIVILADEDPGYKGMIMPIAVN